MKKLLSGILSLAFFAVVSTTAYASYGCQPIYGGGQTCVTQGNLLINKTVQNPVTFGFVDNLSVNDPRYNPDQNINFQISVTNTGDSVIAQATVVDTLPLYVSFISGPGNFDSKTKKLTFVVVNLNPNETRVFTLSGKIASISNLPTNQGVTCDVNQSSGTADNGQVSNDNAQFCIQENVPTTTTPSTTKGGLPIYPVPQKKFTTPATGPEMLPIIGIFGSAISGIFLRKKSSK
jgi:uncharacterized repeat protein (TIGR01451 family)